MDINITGEKRSTLVGKLDNTQQKLVPGTEVTIQDTILDIPRLLGELPTLNLANATSSEHEWYMIDVKYSIAHISASCMMRVYLPERDINQEIAERIFAFAVIRNQHQKLLEMGNEFVLISFVQESYEEIVLRSPSD